MQTIVPNLSVAIAIPSRGRWETLRPVLKLFPSAIVVCDDDEVAKYEASNPGTELRVAPPMRLPQKRNWILDNFNEEVVFQVDDDACEFALMLGSKYRPCHDPQMILDVIRQVATVAKMAGTSLFGFQTASHPKFLSEVHPFRLVSYITGESLGIIGRKYRFDPKAEVGEDVDFSMQVIMGDRFVWKDCRFSINVSKTWTGKGGCGAYRTEERHQRTVNYLRKKWGEYLRYRFEGDRARRRESVFSLHVER